MTLTVCLDDTLAAALAEHCAAHCMTKSRGVQESLAAYLVARQPNPSEAASAGRAARVSANYRAFAEAGLVGTGELGGASADKATVQARAMQRIRRSAP